MTALRLDCLLPKLHWCFDRVGRHSCKSRLAFPQGRYAFRIGIPSWRLSSALKRAILLRPCLFDIEFLQVLIGLHGSCCLVYHGVIIILFLIIHSCLNWRWRLSSTTICWLWRLEVELRLLLRCSFRHIHRLSLSSLNWLLVWYFHWLFLRYVHLWSSRSFGLTGGIGIWRRLNTLISNCRNGFFAVFGLLTLILCLIIFFFLWVLVNLTNWCFRFSSTTFYALVVIKRRFWGIFNHWLLFDWRRL